ncbi:glyoxalase [[Bacillus] sp. KCTC 13219]|nr:glyoxalase [[Bacillus] sp. KCTC 13219]
MIHQIGQIMLYVNDQEAAARFWTEKIGFVLVKDEENHGMRIIEIAPAKDVQTSFVLHNKAMIAQMQPELNLGTPSIMFYATDVEALYEEFKAKGITVGDLITIPAGKLFNFADDENNYFALIEKAL